jgi:hypothetical protein
MKWITSQQTRRCLSNQYWEAAKHFRATDDEVCLQKTKYNKSEMKDRLTTTVIFRNFSLTEQHTITNPSNPPKPKYKISMMDSQLVDL